MKRILAALAAGVALGSAALAGAQPQETWIRNGVVCAPTGTGKSRGVVCGVKGSPKLAIVNQRSIIVGTKSSGVLYVTSSR